MSEPPDLKSWLHSRIHTTRTLLTEITTSVQSQSQEIAHEEHTRRLNVLTHNANTDLLDIEAVKDINATELEDFKASIYNIERKTSAVYNDLCTREAHNIRPMTILAYPETSLEDRLCNIEALLKEAETFQDTARQHEYTQRTKKLISEAKTNLLAIKARHGDDIETIELDALRASLDYATFNTNMIFMAPYKKNYEL